MELRFGQVEMPKLHSSQNDMCRDSVPSRSPLNPVHRIVYTNIQSVVQPVVQPVWQPVECLFTRCSRLFNRGCQTAQTVEQLAVSYKQGFTLTIVESCTPCNELLFCWCRLSVVPWYVIRLHLCVYRHPSEFAAVIHSEVRNTIYIIDNDHDNTTL